MYVAEGTEVMDNPLHSRIARWHAFVQFPAVTVAVVLVGVLTVLSNHAAVGTGSIIAAILESIGVSVVLTLLLAYSYLIHAPRTVTLEGSAVVYDATRWALILPKRLRLAMPVERISHTGIARWGGVAAVFGVAEIRGDFTLSGLPFRDYVFLSPEVLERLGLAPARRYEGGRDLGPWSPWSG